MGPARRTWPFRVLSIAAGIGALSIAAGPVVAQTPPASDPPANSAATGSVGVGVVAPAPAPAPPQPAPEFGFESGIPPEQQGAREQEFYPERVRSIHQPAFLHGANRTSRTTRTSGVRWGLSGWTAPRIPYDSQRESSGGAAFGLTIEWGTPLEPPTEPTPPSKR